MRRVFKKITGDICILGQLRNSDKTPYHLPVSINFKQGTPDYVKAKGMRCVWFQPDRTVGAFPSKCNQIQDFYRDRRLRVLLGRAGG